VEREIESIQSRWSNLKKKVRKSLVAELTPANIFLKSIEASLDDIYKYSDWTEEMNEYKKALGETSKVRNLIAKILKIKSTPSNEILKYYEDIFAEFNRNRNELHSIKARVRIKKYNLKNK
jgi:hypothetical protein